MGQKTKKNRQVLKGGFPWVIAGSIAGGLLAIAAIAKFTRNSSNSGKSPPRNFADHGFKFKGLK